LHRDNAHLQAELAKLQTAHTDLQARYEATLRKQAGRTTVKKLARELKRTEGALRQKASSLGISLRPR
jgi:hypothetical protein